MCFHGFIALHRLSVGMPRFVAIGALVIAFIVAMKVLHGIIFMFKHGFSSRRRWSGACPRRHEPPQPASKPAGSFRPPAPPISAPRYMPPPRFERSGAPSWSLLLVALFFFCLVAVGFRFQGFKSDREPLGSADHSSWSADSETSTSEVGYGKDKADAKQDALEKANGWFLAYVAKQNPPLEWQPPTDYVQKHLELRWTEETPKDLGGKLGKANTMRLDLQITAKDREEIASLDHQARRENRQFFLAKILAALVALFTAIAGYVRVDAWSKGYYTGWLRLATAGFIGAVGAAAWVWMRHV